MHQYRNVGRFALTPQSEPIPGREADMTPNSAGGYSFAIDDAARLQRFLILGSASNTLYATARTLTKENLSVVERLLSAGKGREVVDAIVNVSQAGRAASNDPALFALARCVAADAQEIRQYALSVLSQVARTGTHLLHFVAYVKQFRGWGRSYRRAVANWFNGKQERSLAYQLLKYQNRDGYSQRDVLRLAHPKAPSDGYNALYHWVVKGWDEGTEHAYQKLVESNQHYHLELPWAYEQAKKAPNARTVAAIIKQHRLPREAVPTEHLHAPEVWEALLEDMPMEAMMRNLATMTREGIITPMGAMTRQIAERLHNGEAIRKARLHPLKILAALLTYQGGHGVRGQHTWTPVQQITDALNDAFYLAFSSVEPTGKRILLALDVSGSMASGVVGNTPGLTPRVAAAAMALVTAATEPQHHIMAFSRGFVPLSISPKQRLDDVLRTTDTLPFDVTDCAVPMLWAGKNNVEVDAFVVYTDSETWSGRIQPVQALAAYRQKFTIPAKLVVVGMVSNGFSLADPADGGMMDCVGFDTAAPEIINSFLRGDF